MAAEPAREAQPADEEQFDVEGSRKEAVKLIESDPARAANLLSKVLEILNKRHGEMALECAQTYVEYGQALLEAARADADVLGARAARAAHVDTATEKQAGAGQPQKDSAGAAAEDAEEEDEGQAADGAEGEQEDKQDGEEGGSEDENDDGEEGEEDDGSDLALAWEMTEIARVIYEKEGGSAKHALQLADVHMTLGDISQEKGDFETAVGEYDKCETLLKGVQPLPIRRLAEVHFKAIYPLQLLERLPEALAKCQAALQLLSTRKEEISVIMDTPVEGETGDEAEAEIERLEAELEGLEAIIGELKDKEDDIRQFIQQAGSMRQALVSAMKMMASAVGGGPAAGSTEAAAAGGASTSAAQGLASGNVSQPQQPGAAAAAGGAGQAAGAATSSAAAAAPAGPVKDLGVVGRGRKRITLQPQGPAPSQGPAASAPMAPADNASAPASTAAAAPVQQQQQQKRKLDEPGTEAAAAAIDGDATAVVNTSSKRLNVGNTCEAGAAIAPQQECAQQADVA